ncbi:MAG: NAD(P)-dependent dehydrogenase (short-subunit alcohol dehydrogenase family) [Halieaceae bacterium]|jgi:NAD(P)-dependent dehydrogenase (short-subunit alcohol dehydrogenase family)
MQTKFPGLGPETVVLVTAGASGIGRCIAESFLAQGCRVHVCDIAGERVDEFLQSNSGASGSVIDVGDSEQVEELYRQFGQRYDRLDVLVNNAGISGPSALVEDTGVSDWETTIAVDLNSVFYCTRLAAPMLKASAGSLINLSSTAGTFGCPHRSAYVAAKWAICGLTKTWAMEMGAAGVRVNALCPGSVGGSRMDGIIARDASQRGVDIATVEKLYTQQMSMQRFVDAQDIANMAVFLASDLGKSISGQFIGVDGNTETLTDRMN